jgi:hypothetical protein
VILLCDEDIGTKVPTALTLVGHDARSLFGMGWVGKPDTWWLTKAGQLRWLVFSCNTRMLRVPSERAVIQRERVGIVFLTSGEEYLAKVLWLLLVKWPWLEEIDGNLRRPFAKFLSPTGRVSDSYRNLRL